MKLFNRQLNANKIEEMKTKRDLKGLFKAATENEDRSIRIAAARTLWELNDERGLPLLVSSLTWERNAISDMARIEIMKIGAPAIQELEKHIKFNVDQIRSAVNGFVGPYGIQHTESERRDTVEKLRRSNEIAFECLEAMGAPAIFPLISFLKYHDEVTQNLAVNSLSIIRDERAVPALIEALRNENTKIRAIYALKNIGDQRAIRPLINIFREDGNWGIASQALTEFGDIAVKQVIEEFILSDLDYYYVHQFLERTRNIGPEKSIFLNWVTEFLSEVNPESRVKAISLISSLGGWREDSRITEKLLDALEDKDSNVQIEAALTLTYKKDKRALLILQNALKNLDMSRARALLKKNLIERAIKEIES